MHSHGSPPKAMAEYYNPTASEDPRSLLIGQFGPDQSIVAHQGRFYLTHTEAGVLRFFSAATLDKLGDAAGRTKKDAWVRTAAESVPFSRDVWAPRLYAIEGRWYVYASSIKTKLPAGVNNYTRRIVYWRGPPTSQNPDASGWEFKGALPGFRFPQWANDPAVFTVAGQLYLIYSGWDLVPQLRDPNTDQKELDRALSSQNPCRQNLYLLAMTGPEQVSPAEPTLLAIPDLPWEFNNDVGIIGAPVFYSSPGYAEGDADQWAGILYSAGPSWTGSGRIGRLRLPVHRIVAAQRDGSGATVPFGTEDVIKDQYPVLQAWNYRFPHQQPFVPAHKQRIVSDSKGAWNKDGKYPKWVGSPTVVWTNSKDLAPYSGSSFNGIQSITTTHLEASRQQAGGSDEKSIEDDMSDLKVRSDDESGFTTISEKPAAPPADQPVPWLVFSGNVEGVPGRSIFAQRIENHLGEGPHVRMWVGTPGSAQEVMALPPRCRCSGTNLRGSA